MMEFEIRDGKLAELETPCLILGIHKDAGMSEPARTLDKALEGRLRSAIDSGDFNRRTGSSLLLRELTGMAAQRLLLIGLGNQSAFDRQTLDKALAQASKSVSELGLSEAILVLPGTPKGMDLSQTLRQIQVQFAQLGYRYTHTKKSDPEAPASLARLGIWLEQSEQDEDTALALSQGRAIAQGIALTRDLGNLPGNICTPSYLADRALELADRYGSLSTEILDEAAMEKLGMGALLSVSRGSREPAKLIVMRHRGTGATGKPLVLVGKGLTFDAGGISLKPAAEMDEMKYDMAGGAGVFGAMVAACELDLPLDVIGVVPASENLPGGAANKPGDIVTSMAGKTIEILNTDAEGRLILCDALTYVSRFDPELVIDMATLTGAVIIALGRHPTGLFTNDDDLAEEIETAADASGDRVWRLPLWDDYQKQLDSNFADMANIGGRDGGSITAAAFLSRFTKDYRWAHLDIAGTAWNTGKDKGATGRPVPLLSELLIRRARH